MTYTDIINSFTSNPQNPNSVQMPADIFIALDLLLGEVDISTLSDEGASLHPVVCWWIDSKKNSIRSRQAYAGMVHARTGEEKQEAYENYRNTKELFNAQP